MVCSVSSMNAKTSVIVWPNSLLSSKHIPYPLLLFFELSVAFLVISIAPNKAFCIAKLVSLLEAIGSNL